MAKTTRSVSLKRGYFKVNLTAAINTALSLGIATPPEVLDLSSVVESLEQNAQAERILNEDFVIGDDDPIITPENTLSAEAYLCTMYYTQGKETLGSGTWDPYTEIIRAIHEHDTALPVQFDWSVGGAVGDEEESTSATDCYITAISKPVVGGSGKVRVTFAFRTPKTTRSIIT